MVTLGATGAIAIAYFLVARLGLALLSVPSDVAAFWPASGVATGILIVFGRRARPAVVVGVIIGTVAANLLSDRNLLTSLLKGLCNAGEAVLVAALIERWFGLAFAFDDLRRVLGFVAATCFGAATSALGGAVTMTQFHIRALAPFWDVWRAWFLSDGVGIVMVTPLVIGLAQAWRKRPSRAETIEGMGVLTLLAIISLYAITHPTGSWLSFDPDAAVLPLLLWLIARCKPVFGIAGAFFESLTVIYATTFGIGHLGNPDLPIGERVNGAQVVITMVTLYTLVLVALFAQRTNAEEGLRDSERRLSNKNAALEGLHEISSRLWLRRDLRQALDEILAGAIELLGADMGSIRIWDSARGTLRIEAHRGINHECLDLLRQIPVAGNSFCEGALQSGERMVIEDVEADRLFTPFVSLARAAGYRAMQSTPILSREGKPLGMLATHFRSVHKPSEQDLRMLDLYVRQAADIIEHHKADNALRESKQRLSDALESGQVVAFEWDAHTCRSQRSDSADRILGLVEADDFLAQVNPDDRRQVKASISALSPDSPSYALAFRFVRSDGRQVWLEETARGEFDATGQLLRIKGLTRDITERKDLEDHKNTLISELDHRVKNVLATVSAVASRTQETSSSMAEFVAALDGRIKSMAITHELLSYRRWQGIPMTELVRRELAPYSAAGNTQIDGPDVVLRADAGQLLAMVFHELATNAAKFGAISTGLGSVLVRWSFERNGHAEACLLIDWEEKGGPNVVPPKRAGFGTSVVREMIPYELGGTVDYVFAPAGVRCKLEIPARWLSIETRQTALDGAEEQAQYASESGAGDAE
jgi:PAS domain S-box-containing protein